MTFTYNDEGLRTSKTVNGATTTYLYDGSRLISGYYSSKPKFTGELTVRNWLAGKSFEFPIRYGWSIYYRFGGKIVKKIPSYDDLLELFLDGVEKTKNIDYLDKSSIKKSNRGVDEYRKAAKKIGELYPENVGKFSILLSSNDVQIRVCCAICMIEMMPCSVEQQAKAYSVVNEYYNLYADDAEKMMVEVWLKEHRNI